MKASRHSTIRRKDVRRQQDSQQSSKTPAHNGRDPSGQRDDSDTQGGFHENTFDRHAAMLDDARMSQPMYAHERASLVQKLQRDYGNKYVTRLVDHISRKRSEAVQTKLQVGPAGDAYEQEADAVAKQVMSVTTSQDEQSTRRQVDEEELQMNPLVQRQVDEDELQMKPIAQRQVDEDELQMKPIAQRQVDEDELQMKPIAQRQVDEEELQMKPIARQISEEGGEVDSGIEGTINSAKGSGQSLPDNVRRSMEGAFGADFSGVKIHTGDQSNALNESISARAFTTGQDIFFNKGEYNPGSSSGKEVLAHELTHVVQQNGSAVQLDEQPVNRMIDVQRQDMPEVPEDEKQDDLSEQEEHEWLQAKSKVQRQADTAIQRAWTGRRQLKPLSFLGKPWVVRKKDNIVNLRLFHEHIFFEDEQNGNLGHMGKNGVGPDTDFGPEAYSKVKEGLDDERMRTAVHLMGNPGAYGLLSNNCQDYVQGVLAIYDKLSASAANLQGSPVQAE
jgi:hypothetical protein